MTGAILGVVIWITASPFLGVAVGKYLKRRNS